MAIQNIVTLATTALYLNSYAKGAGQTANMLGNKGALSDHCCIEGNSLVFDYKGQVNNVELLPVQVNAFASRFIFERAKGMTEEKRQDYMASIQAGYMEQAHESSYLAESKAEKQVSSPLAKAGKVRSASQVLSSFIASNTVVNSEKLESSINKFIQLTESSTKKDILVVLNGLVSTLASDKELVSYSNIVENEREATLVLATLEQAGFKDIKPHAAGYSASLDMSLTKTFQAELAVNSYKLVSYNVNLETGLLDIVFSSSVIELEL